MVGGVGKYVLMDYPLITGFDKELMISTHALGENNLVIEESHQKKKQMYIFQKGHQLHQQNLPETKGRNVEGVKYIQV